MRIGLVTPYSWTVPGGVNDHIANLAYQLESRGHEPWILGPVGGPGRSQQRLPERFIPVGSAVPFPSNGSKAYVNTNVWMFKRMERILANNQFDVLHCHEPCTPSVAACTVLRRNAPVVGTFHAALDDSILYRYLHVWARKIIDALAVKIAVSEAAKEYVAARFGGTYRIIPNGVPVDLYEMAREGERIPGRILFIGRAEPRKGLLVLLRAFAQLRLQRPDATLVLVGPRWSQVHGLVERSDSGLTWPIPGIAALGRVSHEVKVEEMGSAEILCVPSLQGESFGIVLAEGLAAGLPVVASDLPGYRSVLKDGRVGVLVPPRDHVALATTLLETLADTDGRATLTANGIEAAEELAWERVAARVMETYQEAVEIGVGAVS
ncbi:MAG: glycosyltransferase family 4 protein [Actinobacteria bacterium]|nr:glycosyltransferase family 4 protein [Actinomycetota bacterium]